MIVKIVHIRTADNTDFADKLRIEVAKMQNECGLEVEVQYQTSTEEDGYNQYVVYSALVVGRLLEERKAVRNDGSEAI